MIIICIYTTFTINVFDLLQFSSLGSLDEKWMAEFALSLSSGVSEDKKPLGPGEPLIVWPTVEDIRCSLEVILTHIIVYVLGYTDSFDPK